MNALCPTAMSMMDSLRHSLLIGRSRDQSVSRTDGSIFLDQLKTMSTGNMAVAQSATAGESALRLCRSGRQPAAKLQASVVASGHHVHFVSSAPKKLNQVCGFAAVHSGTRNSAIVIMSAAWRKTQNDQ